VTFKHIILHGHIASVRGKRNELYILLQYDIYILLQTVARHL